MNLEDFRLKFTKLRDEIASCKDNAVIYHTKIDKNFKKYILDFIDSAQKSNYMYCCTYISYEKRNHAERIIKLLSNFMSFIDELDYQFILQSNNIMTELYNGCIKIDLSNSDYRIQNKMLVTLNRIEMINRSNQIFAENSDNYKILTMYKYHCLSDVNCRYIALILPLFINAYRSSLSYSLASTLWCSNDKINFLRRNKTILCNNHDNNIRKIYDTFRTTNTIFQLLKNDKRYVIDLNNYFLDI